MRPVKKPVPLDPRVLYFMAQGAGAFLSGLQPRMRRFPGRRGSVKIKPWYYANATHCELGLVFFDHLCELGCDLDFIALKAQKSGEHPFSSGMRVAVGAINADGYGHSVHGRPIPQVDSSWLLLED